MFDAVAPQYDQLNDLFSLGLHRLWKRQLVAWLQPLPGESWLDLCCGTGDLALMLAQRLRPGGSILGLDAAAAPLARAAQRASLQPWLSVGWQQGDAIQTGLASQSFDGIVMAYGLRNLVDAGAGLKEILRLLRPGGRAGVLDFNRLPTGTAAERFQRFYLRHVVVPMAGRSGLKEHYAYLEKSLSSFPQGNEQERLSEDIGFSKALHRPLAMGQMGLLLLQK